VALAIDDGDTSAAIASRIATCALSGSYALLAGAKIKAAP
jgi:hypothetical protein